MEDKNIGSNTNECPVDSAQEFEGSSEYVAVVRKCSQLQLALDNQKDKVYRQSMELLTKDKVIMVLGERIERLELEIKYSKVAK